MFVALVRSLCHYHTTTFYFNLSSATSSIGELLPNSSDGGARTAACLRLVLVSIVVARWSKDLVFFINF
jgi:hypothetical protein